MKRFLFAAALPLIALYGFSQTNPNLEQGIKPYGSYDGSKIDTVNLESGNLTVDIPIIQVPQRGSIPNNLHIIYNGKNWAVLETCNTITSVCKRQWHAPPYSTSPKGLFIAVDNSVTVQKTTGTYGVYLYTVTDFRGNSHQMVRSDSDPRHSGNSRYHAVDGSGYLLSTNCVGTNNGTQNCPIPTSTYVYDKHGNCCWIQAVT